MEVGRLAFWRARNRKANAASVYKKLANGEAPELVEDLPSAEIFGALRKLFPKFSATQSPFEIDIPRQQTAVTISWSAKHIEFAFVGDTEKQMNRVVETMTALGLPCYEVGRKMHSLDHPPKFGWTPAAEARLRIYEKLVDKAREKIWSTAPTHIERMKLLQKHIDSEAFKRQFEEACRKRGVV